MILKNILFKNFILKIIKYQCTILDLVFLIKQIVILYIISHAQAVSNTSGLLINHFSALNMNLKIFNFFTNIPYISHKKINNFSNNWRVIQKQLCLLKWVVYLIHLINKNEIQLSFTNIIKLFKKFIILKKNYWTINNLRNPACILIISKDFQSNLVKKYKKFTKQLFFITSSSNISYSNYYSILTAPNLSCVKLILELIITANVQGKYFVIKKVSN